MYKLLFALSFAVTPLAALAEPSCPSANATPESQRCMDDKIAAAEALLSKYIDAAQREADDMNSRSPPNLAETQKVWLKYRESHCGDAYLYWLEGSYRYEAVLNCQLELTHSRAHEVWSTFLTRLSGSPPVLPEP